MKSQKLTALSLTLKEALNPEFIREVLDRCKVDGESMPRAKLLRSRTLTTRVRKKVLATFTEGTPVPRLADIASFTPSELRRKAKLGDKTLRWLEEYLRLLGVVLPRTKSVYGMSRAAQKFLESL